MSGADPALGGAGGSGSDPSLLEVGSIVKPHGLRGDVIVTLSTNREERIEPGAHLTTGEGRELEVARSSPHGGRYIVTFEGV
ncbi:MAG: ribosome maturation factor RimM, partial [Acidimicrobiales bacterium]